MGAYGGPGNEPKQPDRGVDMGRTTHATESRLSCRGYSGLATLYEVCGIMAQTPQAI